MADWYISSPLWLAVAAWQANHAYNVGDIVRQAATPTQGNERCFRCSSKSGTGTSGASEPSWTLTKNGTTTDNAGANQVVWTECTGQSAYNSAGNWTAPSATFDLMAQTFGAVGDNYFIDSNHTETWNASTRNYGKAGTVQVVTVAGSTLPPTAEHAATGVVLTYTGSNGYPTLGGGLWNFNGVSFAIGSGSFTVYLQIAAAGIGAGIVTIENGSISLNTTSASAAIWLGASGSRGVLILRNCPITWGNAGQGFWMSNMDCSLMWLDTPNAVAGTSPTNLLLASSQWARASFIGLDLSSFTGNILNNGSGATYFGGDVVVSGCKLNAATILSSNLRTQNRYTALSMVGSDSGSNVARMAFGTPCSTTGWLSTTALYRTGGAKMGGIAYALAMAADSTSTGAPTIASHPISPPMTASITTTGVAKTITVHVLADKATLPTTNMMWLEARYCGTSGSPYQSAATNGTTAAVAKGTPTNLTQTTEVWSGGQTARANSTNYTKGQSISVSSNPDRVFFCTTGGVTSGSLPAGYATAVDGGSVVDGAAVFRAGYRLSLSLTVTPQQAGWVEVYLHYVDQQTSGNVTSIYLDHKLEIS